MPPLANKNKFFLNTQEWALMGVSFLWGSTFLIIHLAVKTTEPFFFVGFRFIMAGIFTSLLFHKSLRHITKYEIFAGSLIGFSICFGYGLQTVGLQSISSSQSAFITAIYVPLVPLLQWIIFKKSPKLTSWIGIFLAFIGLIFISGQGFRALHLSYGELLTLIGTMGIAFEIVFISLFSKKVNSRHVTIVQLYAAGIFAFLSQPFNFEGMPKFSWTWFIAGLSLALMSATIQLAMNWAQKSISPTRATIIYTGEPVFAAIIGRVYGERLPPLAFLGALFIIFGILIAEISPKKRAKAKKIAR